MAKGRRRPQGHPAKVATKLWERKMRRGGVKPAHLIASVEREMHVLQAIGVLEFHETGKLAADGNPEIAFKFLDDRELRPDEIDAKVEEAIADGRLVIDHAGYIDAPTEKAA